MTIGQKDFDIIMQMAIDIKKGGPFDSDIAAENALKEFVELYRVGNKFSEEDYNELLFQVTYNLVNLFRAL